MDNLLNISTIIVAGGSGSRMGSEIPKQFLPLGGMPILMQNILALERAMKLANISGYQKHKQGEWIVSSNKLIAGGERSSNKEQIAGGERSSNKEQIAGGERSSNKEQIAGGERSSNKEQIAGGERSSNKEQIAGGECNNQPSATLPNREGGLGNENILRIVNNFIVVLPEEQVGYWKQLCLEYDFQVPHQIAIGGASRFESVRKGLQLVDQEIDIVVIHDGVRPFIKRQFIENCIKSTLINGSAIPIIRITDSLRRIVNNSDINVDNCNKGVNTLSEIVDRDDYCAVQTPQMFEKSVIMDAYHQAKGSKFTDDASVLESVGGCVTTVEGDFKNIKITTSTDLLIADLFIRQIEEENKQEGR